MVVIFLSFDIGTFTNDYQRVRRVAWGVKTFFHTVLICFFSPRGKPLVCAAVIESKKHIDHDIPHYDHYSYCIDEH